MACQRKRSAMSTIPTILKGTIHGKTIELDQEPGYPDGQNVTVEVRPVNGEKVAARTFAAENGPPGWLAQLDVDPAVRVGKFVIKERAWNWMNWSDSWSKGAVWQIWSAITPSLARRMLRRCAPMPNCRWKC